MDPIRNRTVKNARRSGRGVAPSGSPPRRRRPGSPMGSCRVPSSSGRRSRVRDRNSSPVGRIPLPQARGRNSRGTEWGLSRNRDPSGSSRMGTEWGLGPFTIEQTTDDVTAIHRLAASRLRRRRLPRHRWPARNRAEIHGKAGATVRDASWTSDQDCPEPGHLMGRRARSKREPGRALERRARWDRSAGGVCGDPRGMHRAGWPRRPRPAT